MGPLREGVKTKAIVLRDPMAEKPRQTGQKKRGPHKCSKDRTTKHCESKELALLKERAFKPEKGGKKKGELPTQKMKKGVGKS